MACYISKHGEPSRSAAYIRWECPAISYARRGPHVLLFSPSFIEIRAIQSGRLVQVIEGREIRLLQRGLGGDEESDMLIIGKRGEIEDRAGLSEGLFEMVQTAEIGRPVAEVMSRENSRAMWEEWDMGPG